MSLTPLAFVFYIFGITVASRQVILGHPESDLCSYYKGYQPIQRPPIKKYRDLKDCYRERFNFITNVPLNKFDNCKHHINKRDQAEEDAVDSFNMASWWNNFRNAGRKQVGHTKPVSNSVKRVCFDEMLNAQIYNRSYLAPLHFKPTISETFGNFDMNNPSWPNFKPLGVQLDNSAKRGTDIALRSMQDSSNVDMETNSQLRTTTDYVVSASTESNVSNDSSLCTKGKAHLIKHDKREKAESKPGTDHNRMIFSFKDKPRTGHSSNPKQGTPIGNFLVEVVDYATSAPEMVLESTTSKIVPSKKNIPISKDLPSTHVKVKNKQPYEKDTGRSATDKNPEKTKARKSRSLFQNPMNSRKFHLMHGLYSENNALMEDALRQAEIQTLNVAAELLRSSRMKQSNLNKFSGPNISNNQEQLLMPEVSKELLQNKNSFTGFQLSNQLKKRTNGNLENSYGLFHSQLEDHMKFLNDLSTEIERRKEELEILERSYKMEQNNIIGIEKVGFKRNLEDKKLHIRDCNASQNINDETLLETAREDLLNTIPEALLKMIPANFSSNVIDNPLLEYLLSSYVNNYLQSLSEQQISSKPCVRNKRTLPSNTCDRPFYFIKTPHSLDELEKSLKKIEGIKDTLIKYKDNLSQSQEKRYTKRWLFSGQSPSQEYHSISERELGNASGLLPHDRDIANIVKTEKAQLPMEINLKNKNKNCSNPFISDYHRKFSILESDLMDLKNSVANIHSGGELYKNKDTNNIEVQVFVSVDLFNSSTAPTSLECKKKSGSEQLPKPIIGTSIAVKELNNTETQKKEKTQDLNKSRGERLKRNYSHFSKKSENELGEVKKNIRGQNIKYKVRTAKSYPPSLEDESDLRWKIRSQHCHSDPYHIKQNISKYEQSMIYKRNSSELNDDAENYSGWNRDVKISNDFQINKNNLGNPKRQRKMHSSGRFATNSTDYEGDVDINGMINDQCVRPTIINQNFNQETSRCLRKSEDQKPKSTKFNDKLVNREYFKDFLNINKHSSRSEEDANTPQRIFRSSENKLKRNPYPNSRKNNVDYIDLFDSIRNEVGFISDNSYNEFLENDFKPNFNFDGGKGNVKLNFYDRSHNHSRNIDRNHYRRDKPLDEKSNVLTDIVIPLHFVHFSDRIEKNKAGEEHLKTGNIKSNNKPNANGTYDRYGSLINNSSLNSSYNNLTYNNICELLNRSMRSKECNNTNRQVLKRGRKEKLADEDLQDAAFDVIINKNNIKPSRTHKKPKVSFSNFLFQRVKEMASISKNHVDPLKMADAKDSRKLEHTPKKMHLAVYKKPLVFRNGISSQQEKPEIWRHTTPPHKYIFTPENLAKGLKMPIPNYLKDNTDDDLLSGYDDEYPLNTALNKYPRKYNGINYVDGSKDETEIVILNYNNYDDKILLPEKSAVLRIKNPEHPQHMNASLLRKYPQRIIWVNPFGDTHINLNKRPEEYLAINKNSQIMLPQRKVENLRNIWKHRSKSPVWKYNGKRTTPEPTSLIEKNEDLYEYIYTDLNSEEKEAAFPKYSKNLLFDYDSNPTTSPLIKISKSTRMTFVPTCTDDMLEVGPRLPFPESSTQVLTIDTSPMVKNLIFQVFMNETPPTLVTIPTEMFKNETFTTLSTTSSTGIIAKYLSSASKTSVSPNTPRSGMASRTSKNQPTTTIHAFLTKTTPHRKTFRRFTSKKHRICTSTEGATTLLRATIHHPHRQRLHRKDPSMKKYRYNITKPPFALRKGPTSPQPWTDTIFFEKFSVKIGFRDSTETSIAPHTIHHRHGLASFFFHSKKTPSKNLKTLDYD